MNLKNIQHKMDRNALRIHNLLNSKIQEQNDLIGKIEKANIDLRQIIEEKNKVIVDLQKEILELTSQQKLIMTEQSELLKQYVIEINEKLNNVELKIETQKNSSRNDTEEVKDSVKKAMNIELEKIENLEQSIQEVKGINKEILWGEIFNNTVSNSDWLTDRSFSPGRWAVGYQYLYSVYRILDIIKPQSILELGLGQSTKLLSQYAKTNPKVNHIVVEHDQDWIDFYKKENEVPKNSKILKLERVTKEYKDDNSVLAFKNFKESLQGLKFDFISINDSKMNEFYNKFLEDLTFNKTETIFRYGLTLEFYYDETDEFENNAPLTIYIANFNRICFLKTTYLGVYNYLSEEKINYEEIVEFLNKK